MRYAAFISYRHHPDRHRATRLRDALHRFARPWNRLRALAVFLDSSALVPEPNGLWESVRQALGESEYLILLASPEAAESEWVAKEVTWWLDGPRPRNLLVVVTGGAIAWDQEAGDFDWAVTTCLPPALRGHFTAEPLWLDLRGLSDDHVGDLSDPQFQDVVATLAATLHGRPKDELIGEDVSQRRRLRRFRRGMLAGMTALALLATTTAVFAFVQRDAAREQARIATARQLAATALNLADNDFEVASLLAVQAYRLKATPETESALYRLAAGSPQLVRFVRAKETVTALALTTSPRYVAVGTREGTVDVWTADGTRKMRSFEAGSGVTALKFSDDDQVLAIATDAGHTLVQDLRGPGGPRRLRGGVGQVHAMAFQPYGHGLATADSQGTLRFYDDKGEAPAETVKTGGGWVLTMSILDEGSKVFLGYGWGWEVYGRSGARMTRIASSDETIYPFNDYRSAASPNGTCFGFVKYADVYVTSPAELVQGEAPGIARGEKASGCGTPPGLLEKEAVSLAISDSGSAAVGTSDGVLVSMPSTEDRAAALRPLTGVEAQSLLSFSPGPGDRLVSAAGSTVALWLLDVPGPTAHRSGISVPDDTIPATQPALAVGPQGTLAWSHDPHDTAPSTLQTWTPGTPVGKAVAGEGAQESYDAIAYDSDGRSLYTADRERVERWTPASGSLVRNRSFALPVSDGFSGRTRLAVRPDGEIVAVPGDGSVHLVDPVSGRRRTVIKPLTAHRTARERERDAQVSVEREVSERGALAAVATDDGRIDVYELPSGKHRYQLDPSAGSVDRLALSERTRTLYAVVDGRVLQRWDLATGRLVWRSDGAGDQGIAVAPPGGWVATLAGDGTVWLWDAHNGSRVGAGVLPRPNTIAGLAGTGDHSSLAFAPDGKRLWSVTENGELLSWDTSIDAWITSLCKRVGRTLTGAERARYLTSLSDGYTACAG
ncbi:toll/interleukin-1 receptor domain-containing protein [Streptomyces sp. NPDC014776]|uniref:toll/interleukin-1 receptor domain-containing protein n=1 Tax=Streptomyces sp. NPDC014776 TaxID=3364909 RepID=UPI003700F4A5